MRIKSTSVQISSRDGLSQLLAWDGLKIEPSAALRAMKLEGIVGFCRVVMVPIGVRQAPAFIKAGDVDAVVLFS